MQELLQANIFFFIASIATIILVVLLSIALLYIIKVGRNIYMLSEVVKNNYKESQGFILALRKRLENNLVFKFLFPLFHRKTKSKTKLKNTN